MACQRAPPEWTGLAELTQTGFAELRRTCYAELRQSVDYGGIHLGTLRPNKKPSNLAAAGLLTVEAARIEPAMPRDPFARPDHIEATRLSRHMRKVRWLAFRTSRARTSFGEDEQYN